MQLSQRGVALFMLCSVVLLSACQQADESDIARTDDGEIRLGQVEVIDTVARAVAPSDRPLVLKGLRGSVRLRAAPQATADLSFVRRGRGESRAEGRSVLEGISITERGTDTKYTYTLEADKESYAAVDIHGRAPAQAALRIKRLSGPVRVDSVQGALTIEHDHGDVTVRGAAAPVEARIKNGDIRVDVRSLVGEGDFLLETSNGDIHLGLPAGAPVQIDAQTNAGAIRTQGFSFSAERFVPVGAGARYNAQTAEGGPTIELRTQNGSITLRAVSPSPADTAAAPVPTADTTAAPQPDTAENTSDMRKAPDTTAVPDTTRGDTTAADTIF
jgi:hypothetical protein